MVGEGCSRFDSQGRFLGIFLVSALPTPPALCPFLSLLFALHFLYQGGRESGWETSLSFVAKESARKDEGRKENKKRNGKKKK